MAWLAPAARRRAPLLACERAPEPFGRLERACAGPVRVVVAGCRLLTGPVVETGEAYAGLATVAAAPCDLEPTDFAAHADETPGVPPAFGWPEGAPPDALLLPPGARPPVASALPAAVASIDLTPDCILDLLRDAPPPNRAGQTVLLLPAELLTRLLVAALAEGAPEVPVLAYGGVEHLRGQLGVLARLRPAGVVADPAAAGLARRAGIPARSLFEGRGRCLLVHALERLVATACLRRLPHLRHGQPAHPEREGAPAAGSGPVRPRRGPFEPVRDVLALRDARRRFVLVPVSSIAYVSSRGGLVTAATDSGAFWTDGSLGEVEARLDPARFLRLDASRIVNLLRVAELLPWTRQRYLLRLADTSRTELLLSRDVGRRLRATLGW